MTHDISVVRVGRRAALRTEIAKINYRIRQQQRLLDSRIKRQAAGDQGLEMGVRSTRYRLSQLEQELAVVWNAYDEHVLHCTKRNASASA